MALYGERKDPRQARSVGETRLCTEPKNHTTALIDSANSDLMGKGRLSTLGGILGVTVRTAIKTSLRTSLLLSATCALAATVSLSSSAVQLQGQCTTSIGRTLDNSDPGTSISIEPKLQLNISELWSFKFFSLIHRPTDPYQNFAIPSIDFSVEYSKPLSTSLSGGFFGQTSLVDVTRWNVDGWVSRIAAGPWASWQITSFFRLETSAASFLQFSEYKLRSDGQAFSAFGVAEEIKAAFQFGRFSLEASLFFVQSRKSRWRNEYYSFQQVAFAAAPYLTVGLAHQLADEVVALSTGLARPFGLFDGRLSRFSGFMRWTI